MRRPRDIAFCLTAALSGIAAAYVLNEWVRHWWDTKRPPDEASPRPPTVQVEPPKDTLPTTDPNKDAARALPPLCTDALPPPLPNGRALLTGSSLGMNPDAMTSSASLHTISSLEEDSASQTTSEADAEPFVDVLSPHPTHVVSRRRSFRNHDVFAASHISFSELGNLVAPENEHH